MMNRSKRQRWEHGADIPLAVSAVAFLGAWAWPILQSNLSSGWTTTCRWIVWITWALVAIDYATRFVLASNKILFLRKTPFDFLVAVLPLLRPLRLLRLVTVLGSLNRYASLSLRGKVGVYLLGSVTLVVFVGSVAELDAERGSSGQIQTFGEALWWAVTTLTTVGYGDAYPVTTTGRFVAAGLMLAGIAVIGVVTASFASWLVERVAEIEEESDSETRRDIQELTLEIQKLRQRLEREDPIAAKH